MSEPLLQVSTVHLLQDDSTATSAQLLTWHVGDFISLPLPLHSFVLLAAGAKPCAGFRVWLHKGDVGAVSGKGDVEEGIEVTRMAAPLPPLRGVSIRRKCVLPACPSCALCLQWPAWQLAPLCLLPSSAHGLRLPS